MQDKHSLGRKTQASCHPPSSTAPTMQAGSRQLFLKYSNLNENIKEIFRIFILLGKVLTASLSECRESILLQMMDSSL